MFPDDEDDEALPPPTISKWPFYLGDATLVGFAIAIATLDGWQLGGIQIFACVLAVALGAVALMVPFLAEYFMFAREEKEDRAGEMRLLQKRMESVESALLKQHEQLTQLESRSGLDDQRYELLTSAIDQKVPVEPPDMSALTERIGAVEVDAANRVKASDVLKKEQIALEKTLKKTAESLDALKSRLDVLEKTKQKPANDFVDEKTKAKNETVETAKRQKKKETGLLKRAIQEKQETASKAVSRIIDPEGSETAPVKAESVEEGSATQEVSGEIESLPEDFSISLGMDLMMDDDLFDTEAVSKPKKAKAGVSSQSKKISPDSEKSATITVEVNKLMGIGNKPFLRGSGAGLSWEKGVEMEFKEIGKWAWSITVPMDEALELQVYRNDKDADRNGKHTLTAGQELEIVPEF